MILRLIVRHGKGPNTFDGDLARAQIYLIFSIDQTSICIKIMFESIASAQGGPPLNMTFALLGLFIVQPILARMICSHIL